MRLVIAFMVCAAVATAVPVAGHAQQVASLGNLPTLLENEQKTGLFGTLELRADRISGIPKWVEVLKRIKAQSADLEACRRDAALCADGNMRDWAKLVRREAGAGDMAQLEAVNGFINRWKYITDDNLYGVRDRWATPEEFFRNSGDCEDFAIAKYYTLRAMGWQDSRLRLVVLHDAVRNMPHAVLSAELGHAGSGKFMILDNLATEPLSDKYMMQYTPYYAVNETTRWIFVQPGGGGSLMARADR